MIDIFALEVGNLNLKCELNFSTTDFMVQLTVECYINKGKKLIFYRRFYGATNYTPLD